MLMFGELAGWNSLFIKQLIAMNKLFLNKLLIARVSGKIVYWTFLAYFDINNGLGGHTS